jgi:amidohydrolase
MRKKHIMDNGTFERLVKLRRKIHRNPEPSFQEFKTSDTISKYLTRLEIPFRDKVAVTGIVAQLGLKRCVPTIALRADMDALPIAEKTGLAYSSKVKNCMHACGHDGHIAIILGAAELLKNDPPTDGNVVFLFQPAEEGGAGAVKMIKEHALNGVDMIFGGHIEGRFEVGQIALRKTIDTSYTDELEIRILGKGGHAARPHETVDAIVVGSLFVMALQNIISRGINPLNPTVISIGAFHAGSVFNAIADEAILKGTVRNTDAGTRKQVLRRIKKTAEALGTMHGAIIEVNIVEGYPPVVNHPMGFCLARDAGEEFAGKDNVLHLDKPSMGGEDFAYYLNEIPGAFVRLGAKLNSSVMPSAHSSQFTFNEEVIRFGAEYFAHLARAAITHINTKGADWDKMK